MAGGRPSIYSDELAKEICSRLMQGESLRKICRDDSMPCVLTICRWLADDGKYREFCNQYARARQIQAEIQADEIIDIADDGSNDWMERLGQEGEVLGYSLDHEHVQRSKLRIDARKWTASKLLPKKFVDKVSQEISGPDGAPVEVNGQWKVEFVNASASPEDK